MGEGIEVGNNKAINQEMKKDEEERESGRRRMTLGGHT